MILTELFFLVVYLSLVGGLFGVVSLLLSRVLKRALPLWFSLCGLALYGIPVLSPQVRLFSPEPEQRLPAFHMAALVWAVGCLLFLAYRMTRLLLAGKSLRRRPPCQNQRLLGLAAQCAQSLGRKRTPPLLETPLDAPISVAGALRPVLLVDAATLSLLTDAQLQAVLTHELTHIRRRPRVQPPGLAVPGGLRPPLRDRLRRPRPSLLDRQRHQRGVRPGHPPPAGAVRL